ncbi:MAG TPA: DNA mismatch repair protein MutS, partial [bacterium]|nr:DNA mismatch repair protein MutS [bacterium]
MTVGGKRSTVGDPAWSPLMRQYFSIKTEHAGEILLFRMGDFWEAFFEDAAILSRVLSIALTSRGLEKGEPIPLAGVPLSALEGAVRKLVTAGYRVAICDQVEDAKAAKGIVRREVIEVVSAGTVSLPGLIDERTSRYLAAIVPDREAGRAGMARSDITTGEFAAIEIPLATLEDELVRWQPAEILMPEGDPLREVRAAGEAAITRLPESAFPLAESAALEIHSGPGFATAAAEKALFQPLALRAAAGLLRYLETLHKAERKELAPLDFDAAGEAMVLDEITMRNLEIVRPMAGEGSSASLLACIDRTQTPMGARLLRRWITRPLLSPPRIAARQDAVEEILQAEDFREAMRTKLERIGDVERLAMRVGAQRANARDLVALASALAEIPEMRAHLSGRQCVVLQTLSGRLDDFTPDVDRVRETLVEAPPLGLKEGGLIRDGYSPELDRLRGLARGAKDWIARFQSTERERTGISNLKIGYNRVFGYYLEVTRGQRDRVPESYERRQTLTGAERYITPELKEREAEILGAQERSWALELELFEELRTRLAMRVAEMRRAAHALAKLDVLLSFAEVARRGNWTRPAVDDSGRIDIRGGRHPVVEAALPAQEFVPNDTHLDLDTRQILLITGPNMAGKSTYLRQVALLCILAQTGSYLPVEEARLGVVDRVFTRVGAADHVARGHSTFMVEMIEVSRILSSATKQSLLLLDEVGRGTSTYDGLAIAWAVLEHLHENPERAARTLFATHYHELTGLAERLERARNLRVT